MRLRKLKITLILLGGVLLVEGGLDVAMPAHRAAGIGLARCGSDARFALAILGATWIALGGWIVAAARDPLRHLNCVKLAITLPLVLSAALIASVLRGDAAFREVAGEIAFNALFATLLVLFLPRQDPAQF